ncbi:hypothetical protein THAR02_06727 [Trichoderma harzianum]|uniref:Uncharacterized protein n=1 Tax=Trichoderma harzianum TaxID=5544 RepID=A0A0F9ZLP7_TRIHA|nr:hypothetical protein THAR02_06727 [Trichoderma harzianum]
MQSQTLPAKTRPCNPSSFCAPVASLCSVLQVFVSPKEKVSGSAAGLDLESLSSSSDSSTVLYGAVAAAATSTTGRNSSSKQQQQQHDLALPAISPPLPWPVARLPLRYQNCTALLVLAIPAAPLSVTCEEALQGSTTTTKYCAFPAPDT